MTSIDILQTYAFSTGMRFQKNASRMREKFELLKNVHSVRRPKDSCGLSLLSLDVSLRKSSELIDATLRTGKLGSLTRKKNEFGS